MRSIVSIGNGTRPPLGYTGSIRATRRAHGMMASIPLSKRWRMVALGRRSEPVSAKLHRFMGLGSRQVRLPRIVANRGLFAEPP
jgi:hypothetical protein